MKCLVLCIFLLSTFCFAQNQFGVHQSQNWNSGSLGNVGNIGHSGHFQSNVPLRAGGGDSLLGAGNSLPTRLGWNNNLPGIGQSGAVFSSSSFQHGTVGGLSNGNLNSGFTGPQSSPVAAGQFEGGNEGFTQIGQASGQLHVHNQIPVRTGSSSLIGNPANVPAPALDSAPVRNQYPILERGEVSRIIPKSWGNSQQLTDFSGQITPGQQHTFDQSGAGFQGHTITGDIESQNYLGVPFRFNNAHLQNHGIRGLHQLNNLGWGAYGSQRFGNVNAFNGQQLHHSGVGAGIGQSQLHHGGAFTPMGPKGLPLRVSLPPVPELAPQSIPQPPAVHPAGHDQVQLPPLTVGACLDTHEHCRFWARNGECEKNPFWMKTQCQRSCRTCGIKFENINPPRILRPGCRNFHHLCTFWESKGECQKNRHWMSFNCQASCETCGPKDHASHDRNRYHLWGSNFGVLGYNQILLPRTGSQQPLRMPKEPAHLPEYPGANQMPNDFPNYHFQQKIPQDQHLSGGNTKFFPARVPVRAIGDNSLPNPGNVPLSPAIPQQGIVPPEACQRDLSSDPEIAQRQLDACIEATDRATSTSSHTTGFGHPQAPAPHQTFGSSQAYHESQIPSLIGSTPVAHPGTGSFHHHGAIQQTTGFNPRNNVPNSGEMDRQADWFFNQDEVKSKH